MNVDRNNIRKESCYSVILPVFSTNDGCDYGQTEWRVIAVTSANIGPDWRSPSFGNYQIELAVIYRVALHMYLTCYICLRAHDIKRLSFATTQRYF